MSKTVPWKRGQQTDCFSAVRDVLAEGTTAIRRSTREDFFKELIPGGVFSFPQLALHLQVEPTEQLEHEESRQLYTQAPECSLAILLL